MKCTRFCPPRVPRVQRKEPPTKRQLGRYPRIPFTNEQIAILEEKFQESPYLSSEEASNLSKKLQLTDVKVKIWFQNRRARKRREEMGQSRKEEVTRRESREMVESTTGTSHFERRSASATPFFYVSPSNVLELGHR
ncbi:homeobox protein H17-like [Diorhabda sublineata]|uniref:homeobox protein H17-like n=1 Tax=Diorhabda sublineata TaxID=1163346 RepID=UPI0024E141B7|nr:homeobox protein H17-like [Diorhabda sublineata]